MSNACTVEASSANWPGETGHAPEEDLNPSPASYPYKIQPKSKSSSSKTTRKKSCGDTSRHYYRQWFPGWNSQNPRKQKYKNDNIRWNRKFLQSTEHSSVEITYTLGENSLRLFIRQTVNRQKVCSTRKTQQKSKCLQLLLKNQNNL